MVQRQRAAARSNGTGRRPSENDYRGYGNAAVDPRMDQQRYDGRMDPRFLRQEVAYSGKEAPGTIVIDTPNHFLYLGRGRGQGDPLRHRRRPSWLHLVGSTRFRAKEEWPDWTPPEEMLKRQPYLPHFMAGGPNNRLGARALYLGSTLYRIHGIQRALDHRHERVVRLHPHAQCGRR